MKLSEVKTQEDLIEIIENKEILYAEHVAFRKEKSLYLDINYCKKNSILITNETLVYFARSFIKEDRSVNENRDSLLNAFYKVLSSDEFKNMIDELDDEYKVLMNSSFIHQKVEGWHSNYYWDDTFKEEHAVLKKKAYDFLTTIVMYIAFAFLSYKAFTGEMSVTTINIIASTIAVVVFYPLFGSGIRANGAYKDRFIVRIFQGLAVSYPVVYLVGLIVSISLLYSDYESKIELAKIFASASLIHLLLIYILFKVWGYREKKSGIKL